MTAVLPREGAPPRTRPSGARRAARRRCADRTGRRVASAWRCNASGGHATRLPRPVLDKAAQANSVRAPECQRLLAEGGIFPCSSAVLGDRLTAGQQILALLIKVRILVPQPGALPERASLPSRSSRPHRLAVRTPASHVGNTGSIPVGVAPVPGVRPGTQPTVICQFCTRPPARSAPESAGRRRWTRTEQSNSREGSLKLPSNTAGMASPVSLHVLRQRRERPMRRAFGHSPPALSGGASAPRTRRA